MFACVCVCVCQNIAVDSRRWWSAPRRRTRLMLTFHWWPVGSWPDGRLFSVGLGGLGKCGARVGGARQPNQCFTTRIYNDERERERVGVPDRSWINPASLLRDPESISLRATVQSWVGTSWRLSDAIGRISDGLAGRVKYPSTTPHENKHSPARRRQAASRDSGILSFFFCQTPIRRRLLLAPDSQLGHLPNNWQCWGQSKKCLRFCLFVGRLFQSIFDLHIYMYNLGLRLSFSLVFIRDDDSITQSPLSTTPHCGCYEY